VSVLTCCLVVLFYLDSSFVGTVDKDEAVLRTEQAEVFAAANAKIVEKKVVSLYIIIYVT
jgi:hypothetical protein